MKLAKAALVMALLASCAALSQEADPERIEHGMKLYQLNAADCVLCHGWNGTGREQDTPYGDLEAGGPSLVFSTMDRAAMIEMVSCGRIASGQKVMPQFRGDAWTPAFPCWGKVLADMPEDQRPLRPSRMLSPREIELVVDYVREVYQGKSMSWEWCSKFFQDFQRICEVWRDLGVER